MKERSYSLLLNISMNKLSHGETHIENVHKFNDMYKNYDKVSMVKHFLTIILIIHYCFHS